MCSYPGHSDIRTYDGPRSAGEIEQGHKESFGMFFMRSADGAVSR